MRVALVFDDPVDVPPLDTDEAKVSQILRNFISNAIKFTERGEVRVSATADPVADTVSFHVRDTGIGIAPADVEVIFEEFGQVAHRLQGRVKGTGLGLPLSRKLAELLGGRVTVDSDTWSGLDVLGDRATGSCCLGANGTRARLGPGAGQGPDRGGGGRPGGRPHNRAYPGDLRVSAAACANSVRDALQIVQAVTPAAIILDVVLTGDESWRLILQLRQQDASANIPLIVSSSTGDDRKAVHLGADEYIPKPVNGEVLIDALDRLTGRRSLTKVLLVDDEEVTHYLVRQLLPRGRFGLSIANNGRDGFERLLELKPDVVLLDLRMPGMDGYTFLDRMSASPTLAEVPAIVMTSTVLSAADHARLGRASLVMSKSDLSTSALIEAITRVQSAPEPIGAA